MRGEDPVAALQEVIADAAVTGVALHVVHITSAGGKSTGTLLSMIQGATKHGIDVTTEMYPYTASATRIESALYDGNWAERTGWKYSDLQWVLTGERLTAESFAKYRKQGGAVISHTVPEEALRLGIVSPFVMIASDGRLTSRQGPPSQLGNLLARDWSLCPRAEINTPHGSPPQNDIDARSAPASLGSGDAEQRPD